MTMTMNEAPYGYCPLCGAPGGERERRPNGDDRCGNGHTYPSADAKKTVKKSGEHRREEKS